MKKEIFDKKPLIMDCTLRDGSYSINFSFNKDDTKNISKVLEENNVPLIEVGHGIGLGASNKGYGKSKENDEIYIKVARKVIKKSSLGTFCIPGIATIEDLERAIDCGINFIRFGVEIEEYRKIEKFIEYAKKKNIFVCTNFLKTYALSINKFVKASLEAKSMGSDLIYIVDSAGGMLEKELEQIILEYKSKCSLPFGFHGHNNLGLVHSNSLLATKLGAKIIDTSLQSIGRSSGNASTEIMYLLLKKIGIKTNTDAIKLMNDSQGFMKKFIYNKDKFNSLDIIAGFSQFHTSYMNKMLIICKKYKVDPKLVMVKLKQSKKFNFTKKELEFYTKEVSKTTKKYNFKFDEQKYYGNEQK
tara:strand:- start:4972 stop:6045 length:1074 start_codon:yes stop_codon:yes gene_type:complete